MKDRACICDEYYGQSMRERIGNVWFCTMCGRTYPIAVPMPVEHQLQAERRKYDGFGKEQS